MRKHVRRAGSERLRSLDIRLEQNEHYGYPSIMSSPVLNREQATERILACASELRALGVARLSLFGSVLRGQPRVDSDVDLLVQFRPGAKSYAAFLAVSELLEARLGRHVELVTTEALSPFIGPRILAEAQDVLRAA
jgi:uncharacterized protein